MARAKNVLGGELESCCTSPMTGFYRDGLCRTGQGDVGLHVVCAEMTEEFLAAQGMDKETIKSIKHALERSQGRESGDIEVQYSRARLYDPTVGVWIAEDGSVVPASD